VSEDPNGWERPTWSGSARALREAAGGPPPGAGRRHGRRFEATYPGEQEQAQTTAEEYAEARAEHEEHTMDEREEW
jgi:hypothetical protein